jgi:hypothetical protein
MKRITATTALVAALLFFASIGQLGASTIAFNGSLATTWFDIFTAPGNAGAVARTIIKKGPVGVESVAHPGNMDMGTRVIIKKHSKYTDSTASRVIRKGPFGVK